MNNTKILKEYLWRRFGNAEFPAEWDGTVYGGGKLSQRYWEYFKAVELLELDSESVVADIGGGSPVTGAGFFAMLIANVAKHVFVLDSNVSQISRVANNIELVVRRFDGQELAEWLRKHPEVTHISCVSVFEHIEDEVREGMTSAINRYFLGKSFVATYEFHPNKCYFEYQLTTKSASALFKPLTELYLDNYCASPIHCENAFEIHRTIKVARPEVVSLARMNVPLWYPVAVKFVRADVRSG